MDESSDATDASKHQQDGWYDVSQLMMVLKIAVVGLFMSAGIGIIYVSIYFWELGTSIPILIVMANFFFGAIAVAGYVEEKAKLRERAGKKPVESSA